MNSGLEREVPRRVGGNEYLLSYEDPLRLQSYSGQSVSQSVACNIYCHMNPIHLQSYSSQQICQLCVFLESNKSTLMTLQEQISTALLVL